MPTVKLRNINPLGQVDLPIASRQGDPFGEEGSGCLEPGEVFEVDADVAGNAPKLNKDGDVIWSTTQERQGGKFHRASTDVADRITKKLIEDYERARKLPALNPGASGTSKH